jgi:glycerol-3-phosphate dehydrogenase
MQRNVQQLAAGQYDVLVIGGGITGACIAHDATLRGLSVALVEKNDFGACTSSASSKLLHGGIRYLPKAQFHKVRESAREQAIFQHLAPHLARWLPFLIPTDKSALTKGKAAMKAAMLIYGICSSGLSHLIRDPGKQPPPREFLSSAEVLKKIPMLSAIKGLTGAQVLFESHMHNSERMTLAFLKTAVAGGARIANYLQAENLLVEGKRVTGARVKDCMSGKVFSVKAKVVVNSAGPYTQAFNETVPGLRLHHRLTGFSRGVHLVTRQLEPKYAMALTTRKKTEGFITRGGRHFFILPWRNCSLIGTTNVPLTGKLDDIRVTKKDVEDFLLDINDALPSVRLTPADVRYAFTGIYPIIAREIKPDTYQGTGEFQIVDHGKKDGIHGIITALGAKFTTARNVAQQTVDLLADKLGGSVLNCQTTEVQLLEGSINDIRRFTTDCLERYSSLLPESSILHLLRNYGSKIEELIELGKKQNMLTKICPERKTLEIEIDYGVRHEMAVTLEDMMFRRTGLGTIGYPGDEAVARCAELMGNLLDWDESEKRRQISGVQRRYDSWQG